MISTDRGALVCDLAETYGVLDYRSLPIRTVATLSVGLRDNSRIKTKMRGGRAMDDTDVLIGHVYDRMTDILTFLGAYKKHPGSLALKLLGIEEAAANEKGKIRAYSSAEAFEKALNRITQKGS